MTDFVQLLVDSLSQCLTGGEGEQQSKKGGTNTNNNNTNESAAVDGINSHTNYKSAAQGDATTVEERSLPNTSTTLQVGGELGDLFEDSVEPQRQASACCSQLPVHSLSEDLREAGDALAKARRQASASSRRSKASRTTLTHSMPLPSDASKRRSSIAKAKSKSKKRKHDIFRPMVEDETDTRTFASRFIDNNFRGGNAILCFARPILDEDEAHCLSLRRSSPSMPDDDTITSTLYFDAQYEHVVQNQAPVPLHTEFLVPLDGEKDTILNIYLSGSHKTIQSIRCSSTKSLPILGTERQSIVDDASSESSSVHSETSETESGTQYTGSQTCESKQSSKQSKNTATSSLSAAANVVFSSIPTPPLCNTRNSALATISDCGNESDQKLNSKSTSETALLTPVCSSRSNASTSFGAKMGDSVNMNKVLMDGVDEDGQMEC